MAIIVAGLERCGLPMKKRRRSRRDDNKTGKTCITVILVAFMAVMSVQIHKVYQKDLEKIALEEQLQKELQKELDRQEELKEYQMYIQSQEYVEDVAKSKLGLLYENQIIFRETKN